MKNTDKHTATLLLVGFMCLVIADIAAIFFGFGSVLNILLITAGTVSGVMGIFRYRF